MKLLAMIWGNDKLTAKLYSNILQNDLLKNIFTCYNIGSYLSQKKTVVLVAV